MDILKIILLILIIVGLNVIKVKSVGSKKWTYIWALAIAAFLSLLLLFVVPK